MKNFYFSKLKELLSYFDLLSTSMSSCVEDVGDEVPSYSVGNMKQKMERLQVPTRYEIIED